MPMNTANKLTLARVFLIPVMMVTLYLSGGESGTWMWVSLGIFVLGSLSDFLDGQIARRCNQVTDFGKFLDPLADKLLTIAVMTMFTQWGRFPAWALMIVLTREFAVTGLRLVAAPKGHVIAAAWSGKVKTASTMVGIILWLLLPTNTTVGLIVSAVIVLTTVYSGMEYFVKNWSCLWN